MTERSILSMFAVAVLGVILTLVVAVVRWALGLGQ